MTTNYLKLGDFYWRKESRTLFHKSINAGNGYDEVGILTHKQFALISCLVEAHPATINKDEIVEKVWQTKHISAESLPQLIIRTRQILNDTNKRILINEPGIGYKLNFTIDDSDLESLTRTTNNETDNTHRIKSDNTIVEKQGTELKIASQNQIQQPWVLISSIALIGLILFQVVQLSSAVYYKRIYENIGTSEPYPYISTKDNRTIITIENHECIYNQEQQLLRCK